MSAVSRVAAARFGDWMKTASAFLAANVRPASDAPAWNSSGVRCGDGLTRCGPSTLYRGPAWWILWTLS